MKAAIFEQFGQPFQIQNVPDPTPNNHGVVIRVMATGVCRSDWHGWMGHDADVVPPHVPGHELAGVIEASGKDVSRWKVGDRVTLPFVCACGGCPQCRSGNHQVCDHQTQPGFTHWGSFAEFVAVDHADVNLVMLPRRMDFVTAASLGCRFVTSFRAVVDQGRVSAGQWVAVHGCGGVGLSAIMIAEALGANVVGIDISKDKLALAQSLGAAVTINASETDNLPEAIREITGGGAHVSIDALGNPTTCHNSVSCLRKRGRHIQVGLLLGDHCNTALPMDKVVANELEIYGSHGIQAYRYDGLLEMMAAGKLAPEKLVGQTVSLEQGMKELEAMDQFRGIGITVIDSF
jgi:alcohol dehydrogenase